LTSIIMLTAKGQAQDIAVASAAGVDHYLVKPFSPLQLLERVRDVLAVQT
jgi:DNA-binding response OmpR family regulator